MAGASSALGRNSIQTIMRWMYSSSSTCGLRDAASRPAPRACRGAGSARRRARRSSPARARRGAGAPSCESVGLEERAPGGELAFEAPARVGRAGRRQPDTGTPSARVSRIARADSPPLWPIARKPWRRREQAARSFGSASSIALVEAAFAAAARVDVPQAERRARGRGQALGVAAPTRSTPHTPTAAARSGCADGRSTARPQRGGAREAAEHDDAGRASIAGGRPGSERRTRRPTERDERAVRRRPAGGPRDAAVAACVAAAIRAAARQRAPSRAARPAPPRCAAVRPARCAWWRQRHARRPCGTATAARCRARRSPAPAVERDGAATWRICNARSKVTSRRSRA